MSIIDSGVIAYSGNGSSRQQRTGTCNRCGMCCAGCTHLIFKATVRINAGVVATPGVNLQSECDIYSVRELPAGIDYQNKGCRGFPPAPISQPYRCSFTWIPAPVELPP